MSTISALDLLLREVPPDAVIELRIVVTELIRDAFLAGFGERQSGNLGPFETGHDEASAYLKQLYANR